MFSPRTKADSGAPEDLRNLVVVAADAAKPRSSLTGTRAEDSKQSMLVPFRLADKPWLKILLTNLL